MALDFTLVLRAETAAAKAELEAAARGIQGVSTATDRATTASKAGATAAQAEAAARQRANQTNRAYTSSTNMAAGATGNLVAQFNDIGMMMAAGQNPLQLAIQQGTQITQVIGPMGAAGAVQALGAAFVSMFNPLNLGILAAIAGLSTLVSWLTSASEESAAAAAETERLEAAIAGVVAETEKLRLQREMMLSGAASPDEQRILNDNNRLLRERLEIERQIAERPGDTGMTGVSALQEALEAQRDEINLKIAANNETLRGIELEREKTAEIEEALDLAGQVRAAAAGITSALQAADGSRLTAAFQGAFPIASQLLGMAQGIIATIGQAQAAAAAQDQLDQMAIEFSPGGQNLTAYGGRTPGGTASQNALATRNRPAVRVPGAGAGGGGGGASAARDEADALQELIAGLEGEIAALRVTDPIQKELLQHRKALAGATEAERQQVEDLILVRERERAAMEAAQETQKFFESTGETALDALIVKGESLNDVFENIVASLAKAVIQAAIFGGGPFGGLFGGQGIGSLIFGGGKAEGGMVYGPGTGTSDSILTPLSNGEYVVNAKATARNRHILEAINAGGRIGGFAEGGYAGSDSRRAAGFGETRPAASITVSLSGARGDREIEEAARRGTRAALKEYDRDALPASVKRVSGDPRRTG